MSCATTTVKYLVFIFNTLCALLGIGTIVVNALALKNVSDNGHMVCTFLIVLGSIVFVVSFAGCWGAIRESTCFTWMYATLLLMVIAANSVILFGYMSHIDGESYARKHMQSAWAQQLNGTDAMSYYQNTLYCCGMEGPTDYSVANLTIPDSCYVENNKTKLYTDGCLGKLIALYEKAEHLIVIFSWSTLGVEFVALICACILAITFRNQQRRSRY